MAITLNSTIYSGISWTQKSVESVSTITDAGSMVLNGDLQNGSENNCANVLWHDKQTLSAGGSDTIDLSGLTRTLFNDSYDISFIGGTIKSVTINNVGTGDISWDFNTSNAFNSPLIGGTNSIHIPGVSAVTVSNMRSGWTVDASHRYIKISDIDGSGSLSEFAIVGVTGI